MKSRNKKRNLVGEILEGIFGGIVVSILLYFVFGQILLPSEMDEAYRRCELFEAKWYQVYADGTRVPVEIPGECEATPGEPYVIETTLGEIEPASVLSFYSLKQDMKIYVGDEMRKAYSTKETRMFGNSSPRSYVFVDLFKEDSGKTLRVEMVSESSYPGTMKPIYYGDKAGIWRFYIEGNMLSLGITAFMIVLSLILVITCTVARIITKKEISILYFSWSVLLLSMWLLTQSGMRQLLFNNISVVGDVALACSSLFMMPLGMYFNVLFGKRYEKVCLCFEVLALLNCVLSNVMVLSSFADSSAVVPLNFALLGIGCITLITVLILEWKKGYIKEYRFVLIGFAFLIVAGVIQAVTYFFDDVTYVGSVVS